MQQSNTHKFHYQLVAQFFFYNKYKNIVQLVVIEICVAKSHIFIVHLKHII
jgi:hypothetical protein